MRIAILDCATFPAELAKYRGVGELVTDWLTPHLRHGDQIAIARIAAGDAFPEIGRFDAFVLPGSECGVYDTPVWMQPLREYLLALRTAAKPLLGICFGHQMMAQTFGGRAARAELGMCMGSTCWTVGGQTFDARLLHQDQVTELPPGAVATGHADHCRYGVIAYDFPALSFQFHPEYTDTFMRDAVDFFENIGLPSPQIAAARESLDRRVDVDLFGMQAAEFLRSGNPDPTKSGKEPAI